jgi:hypothetical protein
MKVLSADQIECLLGLHASGEHPLDILGYGYTSEGARRFRTEQPDFFPQVAAYVQSVLQMAGIFPRDTNPDDAGYRTFVRQDGSMFTISSVEEVGLSRYERIRSAPMSEAAAIREYVRRVVNADYVCVSEKEG